MAGYKHDIIFDFATLTTNKHYTLPFKFHYPCPSKLEILQYLQTSSCFREQILIFAEEVHKLKNETVLLLHPLFTSPLSIHPGKYEDKDFRKQITDRIQIVQHNKFKDTK